MMLKELAEGKESSSIILIHDSVDANGLGLLKSLVISLSQRNDNIHVIVTSLSPNEFSNGLMPHVQQKLKFHNLACNPRRWKKEEDSPVLDSDLLTELEKKCAAKDEKVCFVFESLTELILHRSPAYTCNVLHSLSKTENGQVVALLHGDMHGESTNAILHHTASTIITLEPPRQKDYLAVCSYLHKKASGKILRKREQIKLSDNFDVLDIETVQTNPQTIQPVNEGSTGPDPAANLTFNLSLSDKEKQDRSQMVLPYTLNKTRQEASLVNPNASGKIFYQPDEADDFDEEDPDDDLDI